MVEFEMEEDTGNSEDKKVEAEVNERGGQRRAQVGE
jgi:hypothetical protein